MAPKLLILGASFLQVPIIRTAKECGFHTIVADMNPQAPGIALADEFHEISTLDVDAVLALARERGIDGITTAATDSPVIVLSAVAEELGLPGISPATAAACTNKYLMVEALAQAGVAHPRYTSLPAEASATDVHAALDTVGVPCIMKPTDSSGSRGVILVTDEADALPAYAYAKSPSRSGYVIVEEFLTGSEVSCEIFHDGAEIHLLAITDKQTTGAPHFVELGHSQPSAHSPQACEQINELALTAVRAVGITQGPAHVEIMVTEHGPVVIELGARLGGDLITSHLVPLSTGINVNELVVRQAVGEHVTVPPVQHHASAVMFLEAPKGRLLGVEGLDEARSCEGIVEVEITKALNTDSAGTNSSADRLGHIVAHADAPARAQQLCAQARSYLVVNTQ